MMEARLRQRLDTLRAEYEKGKKTMEDLEVQASNVRATLLRISGAIQVLQEELEGDQVATPPDSGAEASDGATRDGVAMNGVVKDGGAQSDGSGRRPTV